MTKPNDDAAVRVDLALPKAREDGEPVAWMVEGPFGGGECFSIHARAVDAFCDWGKKITPLYALASTPSQAVQAEAGRPLAAGTREEIARIIWPSAFPVEGDEAFCWCSECRATLAANQADAFARADAILALSPAGER